MSKLIRKNQEPAKGALDIGGYSADSREKRKRLSRRFDPVGGFGALNQLFYKVVNSATNSKSIVKCDSLILDKDSKSDAYPTNSCKTPLSSLEHEATVSRINEDNLFYLMSRGLTEEKATELIILGFIERFREELPMEYAVELNQLLRRNL